MSVLVVSCGRTGTNIALAMLAGNPNLAQDPVVENKAIFRKLNKYPKNYLVKSDITYLDDYYQMKCLLRDNPELKLVWTVRDPRDVILSKMRRGQIISNGGDNKEISVDSTPSGAIESITKMWNNYKKVIKDFPNRVYLMKMEDIILETESTAKDVSNFLEIDYDERMIDFPMRITNEFKIQRYGRGIDKNQVEIWKDWETIYNGFFTENKYDIPKLFTEINHMVEYFKY